MSRTFSPHPAFMSYPACWNMACYSFPHLSLSLSWFNTGAQQPVHLLRTSSLRHSLLIDSLSSSFFRQKSAGDWLSFPTGEENVRSNNQFGSFLDLRKKRKAYNSQIQTISNPTNCPAVDCSGAKAVQAQLPNMLQAEGGNKCKNVTCL